MTDEAPQPPLFRPEVLRARGSQADGPTLHIRPVSATAFTWLAATLCAAVLSILVGGAYTKKERVHGSLQPRNGVTLIVAPAHGLLHGLRVQEGQHVLAGDLLGELREERFMEGGSAAGQIESSLQAQRDRITEQAAGQSQAWQAQRDALQLRILRHQADAQSLQTDIALQQEQIASARRVLDQMTPLMQERIVSQLQHEQQRQSWLEQTARLQALQRQLGSAQAELAQAREEQARLLAEHRVAQAGLDRDRLSLQRESIQQKSQQQMWLKAPVSGTVTGLQAGAGQVLSPGAPVLSIVPQDSPLEAVLHVPSTAIGFVRAGQQVRISYDAFPHQRFGQQRGTVRSVSQTDIALPEPATGQRDPRAFFLVRVAIERDHIQAYETDIALRPGHTLTADIEVDRRSLLRWLLDPLFAFSGRL